MTKNEFLFLPIEGGVD